MFELSEFQEYVKENLVSFLPEENKNVHIQINDVRKNNGTVLHGIVVKPEGSNIAPNVYLDGYYHDYQNGRDLEEILKEISEMTISNLRAPEYFNSITDDFHNFEFIKGHLIMVAVNTAKNQQMLLEVPHQEMEDLSIIYKVMLDITNEGMASITIRNEHLDFWNVKKEELHELAFRNTRLLLPETVQSMNELLKEMLCDDVIPGLEDIPADQQMYVISNEKRMNGAVAMLYEDVLSDLSEQIGSDLYILPSSINEVIAVSVNMGTPEFLSEMVREVNGTEVMAEEILSDHVYLYNAETKKISLADTTLEEIRQKEMDAACQSNMHRTGMHR